MNHGLWMRKSSTPPLCGPVTADQTPRQHAVSGDADAQLPAGVEDRALERARDERILDLHVADRVHGMGASERLRAHLGQPDMADVAGLDHLGDRADGLLDRQAWVDPGRAVDVDVVGTESLQSVGERVLGRRGAGVVAEPSPVGSALGTELDAHQHIVAPDATQDLTDEHLVVAGAVEVTRVEQPRRRPHCVGGSTPLTRTTSDIGCYRGVQAPCVARHANQ